MVMVCVCVCVCVDAVEFVVVVELILRKGRRSKCVWGGSTRTCKAEC